MFTLKPKFYFFSVLKCKYTTYSDIQRISSFHKYALNIFHMKRVMPDTEDVGLNKIDMVPAFVDFIG